MKRTLQFKKTDSGYACFENAENIFEISQSDLQFNVKTFYQALYAGGKDFEDIELVNRIEEDKTAGRVYACILALMEKIKEKLAELPEMSEVDDEIEE